MLVDTVFIVACYLVGSIPFMVLLARARGLRVSEGEDLHIALWSKLGGKYGMLGVGFDVIVKGVGPPLVGFYLGLSLAAVMAGAVASIAGQMWPVFRKFDGERGNTPSLGMYLTVAILYQQYVLWLIFIPVLIGAGMKLVPRWLARGKPLGERVRIGGQPPSKSLPVGVIFGFMLMPVISALTGQPVELTVSLGALFFIIALRRLTVEGIRNDLKTSGKPGRVLWNRFFYDRSSV